MIEDIVRIDAVSGRHAPSHSDEIGYAQRMGADYACRSDSKAVPGENDLGFAYYNHPTYCIEWPQPCSC